MTAKKLFSLLMAMMLIVGIFAIPAVAATSDEEGIEPYAEWTHCSSCGASVAVNVYNKTETVYQTCKEPYGMHLHKKLYLCKDYSCSNCGHYELMVKNLLQDTCLG